MFNFKSKKVTLPLFFCIVVALLTPVLAQAELGGSGGTAARDVAAQREAQEKKRERKKLKEAESKKTTEAQPAETQQPAEDKKEAPAEK